MFPNDRKRARTNGRVDENDVPSLSGGFATPAAMNTGGLRPRAVNTTPSPTSSDSTLGSHKQPSLKKSVTSCATRVGATTTVETRRSSGTTASSRSSGLSHPHTLQGGRGKPHRPLRPEHSSSLAATTRGRVATNASLTGAVNGKAFESSSKLGANHRTGSATKSGRSSANAAEAELHATWKLKREELEAEVHFLEAQSTQLTEETQVVEDAIEGMLTDFEEEKRTVEVHHASTVSCYQNLMLALRKREDVSLAAKQRALNRIDESIQTVRRLESQSEQTQEAIVLATEERESREAQLASLRTTESTRADHLRQLQAEEERMKDASYGLSGEVRELVLEMERLKAQKRKMEVAAMETEVKRRELYSLCEELKGSIRVYCRVKGAVNVDLPTATTLSIATSSATTTALASGKTESAVNAPSARSTQTNAVTASEVASVALMEADAVSARASADTNAAPVFPCDKAGRSTSVDSALSTGVRSTATTAGIAAASALPTRSTTSSPQKATTSTVSKESANSATASAATAAAAGVTGSVSNGMRSGRSTTRSSVATAAVAAGDDAVSVSLDEDGEGPAERCLFSYPDRATVPVAAAETFEAGAGTSGSATTATTTLLSTAETDEKTVATVDDGAVATALETTENEEVTVESEAGLPYSVGRSITIHQTRSNATSTGLSNTAETFTFDRVFTGEAHQGEVYRDVEPLVRNAVDGYRVCVFAYGQTGSGKTFTMEGDLQHTPAAYGVTPRALQTILQRQRELAKEGWAYELSCTFIEIYNDVIRDLFQSGSAKYEVAMQQSGNAASYHTIKHSGDRTQITNVSEKRIRSMEEFFAVYKQAVEQRSTAKTDLNDKSSRSHCIFTLSITGTNATIRQRSEGVLCLVDLAGSERVNESGVQGKQFKEAVNINRSLLDLGKCIRALRGGAVVPWRNCKLTYLLQNYLGAKGGKMLMIVTVSNVRQHAPESMNSLRFADRVQETFVGTSVKRVVNMM